MLVCDRGLVLQLPHQCVDEMGVFDDDGDLLEHILKANACLFQAGEGGTETEEEIKSQFVITVTRFVINNY